MHPCFCCPTSQMLPCLSPWPPARCAGAACAGTLPAAHARHPFGGHLPHRWVGSQSTAEPHAQIVCCVFPSGHVMRAAQLPLPHNLAQPCRCPPPSCVQCEWCRSQPCCPLSACCSGTQQLDRDGSTVMAAAHAPAWQWRRHGCHSAALLLRCRHPCVAWAHTTCCASSSCPLCRRLRFPGFYHVVARYGERHWRVHNAAARRGTPAGHAAQAQWDGAPAAQRH